MSAAPAPDDTRDLAQQAIARQNTHEAVCEERHRHLRGDIGELKDQMGAFTKESRDYRHAVRGDLQNLQAANMIAVKEAVTAGNASVVASLTPLIAAVATDSSKTDRLVRRLLWGGASIAGLLLVFFVIQTLTLWGLTIHPVG